MKYIELKGNAREIGRRQGEAFADEIQKYYDWYCVRTNKSPQNLHPSIPAYVEKHMPEIAEEMEGLAEGAGLTYEEMMVYNHASVISGCTPVFFRASDRGPLLAQNLDCEPEEIQAQLVRRVVPDKGLAFLAVGLVGTVRCGNWLNDAGIAKTGVSAHQQHYRKEDGTSTDIVANEMARRAETLDEAFDLFRRHRNLGKVGVALFADDRGNAIHVEGDGDRKWKIEIQDEFAFSTGLYKTGHVIARDEPHYLKPKYAREETLCDLFAGGRVDFTLEGMKRLLGHHAPDPGSVCRHNRAAGSCTQAARLWILRERMLLFAEGPPCTAPFVPYPLFPRSS